MAKSEDDPNSRNCQFPTFLPRFSPKNIKKEFEIEKLRFHRKKQLENRITNGKVIEDDTNTNESDYFHGV